MPLAVCDTYIFIDKNPSIFCLFENLKSFVQNS
jgi:hypothetical protein